MIKLKGIDGVLNKLKKDLPKSVDMLSEVGLIKAAILVRRDMEKTTPKTPIDTSNLRHSFYIVTANKMDSNPEFKGTDSGQMSADHSAAVGEGQSKVDGQRKPVLVMGFSARYAAAVHEGLTKKGAGMKFKRPGAGAKFFEAAIERNRKAMVSLINGELKKI
jgi:hypothetical protein